MDGSSPQTFTCMSHLMRVLTQKVWGEGLGSAFLIHSQVQLALLVQGPLFQQQEFRELIKDT